jgi:hypothetical protein
MMEMEEHMNRWGNFFAGFALAVAAAGCGGNKPTTTPDMAVVDFALPPDLATPLAPTGAECAKPADCDGVKATCLIIANRLSFPKGYCTSQCSPAQNDPQSGFNPKCPGGTGICVDIGNGLGSCYSGCTDMAGQLPCRANYACFNFSEGPICYPQSVSQCNPVPDAGMGCAQDGGLLVSPPDGAPGDAMSYYSGQLCSQVGQDPVGECHPICDPFGQNCPLMNGVMAGCYADFNTGIGGCTQAGTSVDGDPCMYLNSCTPGLACHSETNAAVCRPYCGGPTNKGCPTGETCKDLSPSVPKATLGICGK